MTVLLLFRGGWGVRCVLFDSTLSSICNNIRPTSGSCVVGFGSPFMRLAETPHVLLREGLVRAINVCLVDESPTCSVPALQGCDGGLWSYDYGHARQ